MRVVLGIVAAAVALLGADAYSANQVFKRSIIDGSSSQISSLEARLSMTRRDTIRMPTNTPMVPYKVSRRLHMATLNCYSSCTSKKFRVVLFL